MDTGGFLYALLIVASGRIKSIIIFTCVYQNTSPPVRIATCFPSQPLINSEFVQFVSCTAHSDTVGQKRRSVHICLLCTMDKGLVQAL